jgi:pyruvate dehydrogenase E1 component alpha subunit
LAPVPEAERDWYRDEDPLLIFIRDLVEAKQTTKEEIVQLELNARAAIDQAVKFALASPDPTPEVALQDVFV